MNEQNTEYLNTTYPVLFEYCKHFECGDGWLNLIDDLSKLISSHPDFPELTCRASQVKEKYGTLRFYMDTETDWITDAIRDAEQESAHICELCGDIGEIDYLQVWLKCRCKKCKKES